MPADAAAPREHRREGSREVAARALSQSLSRALEVFFNPLLPDLNAPSIILRLERPRHVDDAAS